MSDAVNLNQLTETIDHDDLVQSQADSFRVEIKIGMIGRVQKNCLAEIDQRVGRDKVNDFVVVGFLIRTQNRRFDSGTFLVATTASVFFTPAGDLISSEQARKRAVHIAARVGHPFVNFDFCHSATVIKLGDVEVGFVLDDSWRAGIGPFRIPVFAFA